MAKSTPETILPNFGTISQINFMRCISPDGFNYNPEEDKEFNMYMIMAMVEELGEISGALKKIYRGFNERELKKMQDKWKKENGMLVSNSILDEHDMPTRGEFEIQWLKEKWKNVKLEAADLFTYFDLFLSRNQIDIKEAVKFKFNQVSKEMKSKYQL